MKATQVLTERVHNRTSGHDNRKQRNQNEGGVCVVSERIEGRVLRRCEAGTVKTGQQLRNDVETNGSRHNHDYDCGNHSCSTFAAQAKTLSRLVEHTLYVPVGAL